MLSFGKNTINISTARILGVCRPCPNHISYLLFCFLVCLWDRPNKIHFAKEFEAMLLNYHLFPLSWNVIILAEKFPCRMFNVVSFSF
jgi:hypothetical protein